MEVLINGDVVVGVISDKDICCGLPFVKAEANFLGEYRKQDWQLALNKLLEKLELRQETILHINGRSFSRSA